MSHDPLISGVCSPIGTSPLQRGDVDVCACTHLVCEGVHTWTPLPLVREGICPCTMPSLAQEVFTHEHSAPVAWEGVQVCA